MKINIPSKCKTISSLNHEDYAARLTADFIRPDRNALPREKFETISRLVREHLSTNWIETDLEYKRRNAKFIYYISLEFLMGRALLNTVMNLGLDDAFRTLLEKEGIALSDLCELEPDAGLGNGGLGRLAACFLDSMATLSLPAVGYGLRYEYGMFRQAIENGYQIERPDNWLRANDPWEVQRPSESVDVWFNCSISLDSSNIRTIANDPSTLTAVPYDRPIVGYANKTVNTLRLWSAKSPDFFDFQRFSRGDLVASIQDQIGAETLTRVLYPDDSTGTGKALRFSQEFFLVTASIADIINRFRRSNSDWNLLPEKVAIQLNDTHPALAVAELMRILVDVAKLSWDQAWELSTRTLAYTNHTLLSEALERWPVKLFESVCPRLLEIIYEINHRFLEATERAFPNDAALRERASLIEEGRSKRVRMAHLAIVGSHSVNGVAQIHSDLLCKTVVPDFHRLFPERFNNKTNGVTPRRWLLLANPHLSQAITDTIGESWKYDITQLKQLSNKADDSSVQERLQQAKRKAKDAFAYWLGRTQNITINSSALVDSQVKRIHAYKRQLLNALHIVHLYRTLKDGELANPLPRVFFVAGKAAPAYRLAKDVIKLISNISAVVNKDPATKELLQVHFLPDYNVSLAEKIIPATDLSEQISTAGFEASGTGNMKFMMNGALTIGTRDGATIEMAQKAREENFFLFGLDAAQVASSKGWYSPRWHYENEATTKATIDLLFSGIFNPSEPDAFTGIKRFLFDEGDPFMHLADFKSYCEAQAHAHAAYKSKHEWSRKVLHNIAASGFFSSDRTITQYNDEIWKASPIVIE